MYLILLGKQSASCTHSCPYCTGKKPWIGEFSDNTVGSIQTNFENYISSGADKKNAANHQNVVNKPLICGDPDSKIEEIMTLPELHIMTGIAGKLLGELESKAFSSKEEGEKFTNSWMHNHSPPINRCVYQGSATWPDC